MGKQTPTRGAELLRAWRGDRTQVDIGDKLGIDSTWVSHLEAGRRRPNLELAAKIAAVTDGAVPALSWLEPAKTRAPRKREARAS